MPKRIGDHGVFDRQIAAAKIIRELFGHAFRSVIESFQADYLFAAFTAGLDADNRGAAPVSFQAIGGGGISDPSR